MWEYFGKRIIKPFEIELSMMPKFLSVHAGKESEII